MSTPSPPIKIGDVVFFPASAKHPFNPEARFWVEHVAADGTLNLVLCCEPALECSVHAHGVPAALLKLVTVPNLVLDEQLAALDEASLHAYARRRGNEYYDRKAAREAQASGDAGKQ
jgi:hypothetical protein